MKFPIETHALGKKYGNVQAVDDLCLQVREGEIYAFLGLNGAGKTTTIRMLLGMIKPTSGFAKVLQTEIHLGRSVPWRSVGYMVETPHAYPELTVRENLEVAHRLHPGTPAKNIKTYIERLGLSADADRRAGNLSHGNSQRLGLAKAMLHQPGLLILDEPANGLDPAGIVEIREFLLELVKQQGVTIFMSSHILAEVARLAGRIGIIHKGSLLQELSNKQLEKNRLRYLVIKSHDLQSAYSLLKANDTSARMTPDGCIVLQDERSLAHPERIAEKLVQAGFAPTKLVVEEEELERYFLRLVGADTEVKNE
jgi:ABC-2 type transport system ATP-binding protein